MKTKSSNTGERHGNGDRPRVAALRFDDRKVWVEMVDGREIGLPLDRFPTLRDASGSQRRDWELIGRGVGVHWPALDLDLSAEGLVQGTSESFPPPPQVTRPPKRQNADEARLHYHIVFREHGWSVVEQSRVVDQCATQTEAIERARKLARSHHDTILFVHSRSGEVRRTFKITEKSPTRT